MLKFSEYSQIPGLKINESVEKIGNDYEVTLTYKVPLSVVKEYIDKIKKETGKNVLEQFGAKHLAEQMMQYTLDQYMTIDNLPSSAVVGDATDNNDVTASQDTSPEVVEADTAAEEPKTEPTATEPKVDEKPVEPTKEEEEEESNYLNLYTTTGNPVNTGFKIQPIAQKSPKNAKVGLYEGLTDDDLKF